MQDNAAKKQFDKIDEKVQDFNYLDEHYAYNPFGKGGGGAPLKDQFGNSITTRKPQHNNSYSKNYANNRLKYSVMSSSRPMTNRAPTAYTSHFGKPRDFNTRNVTSSWNYHGVVPATGTGKPTTAAGQPPPTAGGQPPPTAGGIQTPSFGAGVPGGNQSSITFAPQVPATT